MTTGAATLMRGLALSAAFLGAAATNVSSNAANVPLPEPHSWDTALMMLTALSQYTHVLWPLCMMAASAWGGTVLVAPFFFFINKQNAVFLVLWPVIYVPKILLELFVRVVQLHRSFRYDLGDQYLGLFTLYYNLRDILDTAARMGFSSTRCKLVIIAALMSWQEWLCCGALIVWALLAFTPDLLKPGAGWPLKDAILWVLMQMDWAWKDKWATLGQAFVCGIFLLGLLVLYGYWNERRLDLRAIAVLRRSARRPGQVPFIPGHLLPNPNDNAADQTSKAARLASVFARAYQQAPSLEERLSLPWPTLLEFSIFAGFAYGMLYGIYGALGIDRGTHTLVYLLLLPGMLPRFLTALWQGQSVAWVVAVVGLALSWAVANVMTRRKQREWEATHAICNLRLPGILGQHPDWAASEAATAYVEAKHGPYPSTKNCFFGLIWFWGRVIFSGLCGFLFISWFAYVHYLPAYGLPAYSSLYGNFYCGPTACLHASAFAKSGGGLQSRGGCARGGAGCGANVTADFWAGWWGEMKLAARVNVLAARAWRKDGLEGVHLAMDALMAATSPAVLAGPEVRRRAVAALFKLQRKGLAFAHWHRGEFAVCSPVKSDTCMGMGTRPTGAAPNCSPPGCRPGGDSVSGSSGAGASERPPVRKRSSAASRAGWTCPARDKVSEPMRDGGRRQAFDDDEYEHYEEYDGNDDSFLSGGSRGKQPQANESTAKSKTKLPALSGAKNDVDWSMLFALTFTSIVAAYLVVMQPEWLQSPGKFLSAVVGLLTWGRRTGTRRTKPPKEAPADSGRPGGNKVKPLPPQPSKAGAHRQQKQVPAAAASPATATPTRTASAKGPLEGEDAAVSAPRKQAKQRPQRDTDGARPTEAVAAATSDAAAPTPASSGAVSSSRCKGQPAGDGAAAGRTAAEVTTQPPCSAAASSPVAVPLDRPGPAGSSIASSVAAALAAALPFTASLARQTTTSEPTSAAASSPAYGDAAAVIPLDAAPAPVAGSAAPEPSYRAAPAPTTASSAVRTPQGAAPAAATSSAAATRKTPAPIGGRPSAAAAAAQERPALPSTSRPQPPPRPFGQSLWSSVVSRQPAAPPPRAAALTAVASAATTAAAASAASPVSSSTDSVPDGNDASVPVPFPVPVPVPVPVPIPVKGSAPGSPGTPVQQPTLPSTSAPTGAFIGLNPALARGLASLGRLAPAASDTARLQGARPAAVAGPNGPVAAARSGSDTSPPGGAIPPPRGGLWGNAPGLHPDYCGICQANKREVCVLHGCTVHLSLCTGCAAGFSLGSPCPVCGEPVVQKFPFDVSKL